jgi:hypothetical protein
MPLHRVSRATLPSPLIAISFSACSLTANYSKASVATTRFHDLVDRSEFDAIYDSSSPGFRQGITREQWVGLLNRIKRKLGVCTGSTPTSQAFQATTSGVFVTTNDFRNCANGKLDEQFVWRSVDGEVKLFKYGAGSPLLLTD